VKRLDEIKSTLGVEVSYSDLCGCSGWIYREGSKWVSFSCDTELREVTYKPYGRVKTSKQEMETVKRFFFNPGEKVEFIDVLPLYVNLVQRFDDNEKNEDSERDNPKYPPGHCFCVCLCDRCGEFYEADQEHICRKKNSYPTKLN